jgi:hypothetical protein
MKTKFDGVRQNIQFLLLQQTPKNLFLDAYIFLAMMPYFFLLVCYHPDELSIYCEQNTRHVNQSAPVYQIAH